MACILRFIMHYRKRALDCFFYAWGSESLNYLEVIHEVIGPLLPAGSSVAIFDFPKYPNVGDSVIWLGVEKYLSEKVNAHIVAVDDNTRALPALSDSTVILITGGGNLGDLWNSHQKYREAIVERYPGNRVIQLPQSIHFDEVENFERCRRVFSRHQDFHLLVRDSASYELAKRLNTGGVYLCPDMALALHKLPKTRDPVSDIFGLLRTDKEKARGDDLVADDIVTGDWLSESASVVAKITAQLEKLQGKRDRRFPGLYGVKSKLYHAMANRRLLRGSNMLCSGRVVVTDRLHAHILCTLMRIPHVVMDNSYRKIGNFREVWNTGAGFCSEARTMGEAVELARRML